MTDNNPDQKLSRIETLLVELVEGQQRILFSVETLKADVEMLKADSIVIKSDIEWLKTQVGLLSFQLNEVKEDTKQRYADLRSRIELNNDKLSVIMRELNQIDQDIRRPRFTVADTR
jgi:predicted  nucleic acid-binding Zn-ribbon protein